MTTISTEDRAATERRDYIAGLRKLADLLETHEDLRAPSTGMAREAATYGAITIFGADALLPTLELLRTHVGRPASVEMRGDTAWITWHLDGLALQAAALAGQVFEQVVTGTCRIGSQVREQVEWVLAERWQPAEDAEVAR